MGCDASSLLVCLPLASRKEFCPKKASVELDATADMSNKRDRCVRARATRPSETAAAAAARKCSTESTLQHSSATPTRHQSGNHGPARLPARGAHQHEDHVQTNGLRVQKCEKSEKKYRKDVKKGIEKGLRRSPIYVQNAIREKNSV